MSDSRLYTRLLLPKGHGYPLFHPQPFDDLPFEARKNGTEIGDVGIVTSDGSFDIVFNICRSADDPLNRFGVPDGFESVRLNPGDIAPKQLFYRPGSDVSNTKINKRRLDIEAAVEGNVFFPLGAGAVVEISTSSRATAILLLPDGGSRTNLRRLQVFRDYALKNAQRWYAFVNGTLGRMVESGELYLVTGVDKSSSWSVAALENNSEGRGLSLTLKAAQAGSGSAACAWEWESSSSFANSGPRRGPEEQSWTDNQTVFLRGFKVAIRSTPLKKAIKVLSIADLKPSQILSRDRFIPFSSARSSDGRSGFYRSNTSRSASGDQDTISESSKPYHPADAINAHLLDSFPDALVALTHDDEWAAVINEDKGIPSDTELVERICNRYTVENTSDGVFFQHMDNTAFEEPLNRGDELGTPKMVEPGLTHMRPDLGVGSYPSTLPEILSKNLRSRVFNRISSTGPKYEFEDPANLTPDGENLENLGESVLGLVVTSLILDMYPGLRAGPSTKLRELLLDDATLDDICNKSKLFRLVPTTTTSQGSPAVTDRIPSHQIFKTYVGGVYLDQGLESAKPWLVGLFRPYSSTAYNLLRESHGLVSAKENSTEGGVRSVPASPPSPSSPDNTVNHLALFNESVQKNNLHVDWKYADHPSVGMDGSSSSTAQDSLPRGNKSKAPVWSVEILVDGEVFGQGEGNTKKVARNEAAKQALQRLGAI